MRIKQVAMVLTQTFKSKFQFQKGNNYENKKNQSKRNERSIRYSMESIPRI